MKLQFQEHTSFAHGNAVVVGCFRTSILGCVWTSCLGCVPTSRLGSVRTVLPFEHRVWGEFGLFCPSDIVYEGGVQTPCLACVRTVLSL